jgi:ABC-2 type transport system ATP-binding protein
MSAIEIKNLTKAYRDVTAVKNLSLTIEDGELFALLGVNGAGKSTLIRCLTCITEATSGEALVGGHSITNEAPLVKEKIAVSPQSTAIANNLTVEENLMLMARLSGMDKPAADAKMTEIAKNFGLDSVMKRRAGKLSGGWQRRLSLAMALITEPEILFLDEPTLGLDVLARAELWDIIRGLRGRVTVVLTTHYMDEAEYCTRVSIMVDGEVRALDTPARLKEQFAASSMDEVFRTLARGAQRGD